ncbi:unnamed protein product, partial [Staurois parvus]
SGGQWRDWQTGVEDTEWRPVEELAERGGGQWRDWQRGGRTLSGGQWRNWQRGVEASGGIGREGWRTLNGGQWRDWQRGVEDTERSFVVSLVKKGCILERLRRLRR